MNAVITLIVNPQSVLRAGPLVMIRGVVEEALAIDNRVVNTTIYSFDIILHTVNG